MHKQFSLRRLQNDIMAKTLHSLKWFVRKTGYTTQLKQQQVLLGTAEGPRDALSQLKSCQLLHRCTKIPILKACN